MDFFERQEQARRNTKWLVVYFVAGVALLVMSVYLAVLLLFAGATKHRHSRSYYSGEPAQAELWNPRLFSGVAIGTLTVIALGSLFKTLQLAQGGSAVAGMLGGRLVNPNTTNPDERKLLNVVEEMALASGLPVPQVYVLPEEKGINAFAAGHSASDAVIGVTQGAIQSLTRDELQGVIGHEFSHILNGDMRLNLRLMGIIFGILCVAVIGRILLDTRSRNSREKNPLPLLGLALLLIGWIGVFFGRLIQAAVSRQREMLADASAVQFTRNPAGLAGALKKIGGLSYGSKLKSPHAQEASHLFFGNGVGEAWLSLMATHPPLEERIRALDPSFDGGLPNGESREEAPCEEEDMSPVLAEMASSRPRGSFAAAGRGARPALAQRAVAAAGTLTPGHIRYAVELRQVIPGELQSAVRDPLGACTVVYALLLSDDVAVRSKQVDELTAATAGTVTQETLRVWPAVREVAARARFPLIDLALPGLRHLSTSQYQQFRAAVQALVESDGEIDLFEYVLQKVVLRHLEPHYTGVRKPVIQYYALKPLAAECTVLLSALARVGQQAEEQVAVAFARGAQLLEDAAQVELSLAPGDGCELAQVDSALDRLALAVPQIKKNVLNACAQTVAADGVIYEMEAEMLRAVADTLDCPLPPMICHPENEVLTTERQ